MQGEPSWVGAAPPEADISDGPDERNAAHELPLQPTPPPVSAASSFTPELASATWGAWFGTLEQPCLQRCVELDDGNWHAVRCNGAVMWYNPKTAKHKWQPLTAEQVAGKLLALCKAGKYDDVCLTCARLNTCTLTRR